MVVQADANRLNVIVDACLVASRVVNVLSPKPI